MLLTGELYVFRLGGDRAQVELLISDEIPEIADLEALHAKLVCVEVSALQRSEGPKPQGEAG
jgi:hypothetical protein